MSSIFHHGVSCRPAEYRLCSDRVPGQRSLAAVDREVRFSAADGNIYRLRHRHSAATRPRVDISRYSDLHRNKTQHIVTNGAVVFCQNVPKLLVSHIGVIFPICLNQVTNNKNKIRYLQHNPLKPSPSPGGSATILTTQKTAPCPPSTTAASPSWRWRSSCPRERWKSRSNNFILCENSYYYITERGLTICRSKYHSGSRRRSRVTRTGWTTGRSWRRRPGNRA